MSQCVCVCVTRVGVRLWQKFAMIENQMFARDRRWNVLTHEHAVAAVQSLPCTAAVHSGRATFFFFFYSKRSMKHLNIEHGKCRTPKSARPYLHSRHKCVT